MLRKSRKVLSILLALILLVGSLPITSLAEEVLSENLGTVEMVPAEEIPPEEESESQAPVPIDKVANELPLGGELEEQFDYYIPVNDRYLPPLPQSLQWAELYGWAIDRAECAGHTVDVTGSGDYPDRTYNISLTHGIPRDAAFELICDYGNDASKMNSPVINTLPGLTTQAMMMNFNDFRKNDNKVSLSLEDGEAHTKLYFYCGDGNKMLTVHTFNFTIAEPDVSSDPEPENVESISIATPPAKTMFFVGSRFDSAGMVVMAQLKEGGDPVPVLGYSVEPSGTLALIDTQITVRFGEHTATQEIEVLPSTSIGSVEITNGQMMSDINYFGFTVTQKKNRQYDAVTLYGESKGKFTIQVGEGTQVWIEDEEQRVVDGVCRLELDTSRDGTRTIVQLRSAGTSVDYTFWCYEQVYDDMPQKVVEYLCMASQYTNGGGTGPYGLNGVATLRGDRLTNTTKLPNIPEEIYGSNDGINDTPISLGNFGGYITYYYEEPIIDNPNNPYGVDFIVYSNSHNGTGGFAEPGNVLVSEDGENWYSLAGSLHYDDEAIWGYSITYKSDGGRAAWTDNYGNQGTIRYSFPGKEFYPLFPWTPELEKEITLTGTMLTALTETNEYGNTVPPFPHFGYADCGIKVDTNMALNPYTGLVDFVSERNDGFDLKWAVDEEGLPVDVSDKEFHYVQVQTATNIVNSAIGEKSTEINGMRLTEAAPSGVGISSAPTSIMVDGEAVVLQDDMYIYDDVPVSGAFIVNVDTSDDANIYINSSRGDSRTYAKMPNHEMLRIIVQDGEKEPWIGYFNLVEGESGEDDKHTVINFDPVGGKIDGMSKRTYLPEMTETDKIFPTPVWENREFLGWFDAGGKKYDQYTPNMPAEITLTAQWKYILKEGEQSGIKVSFRLIGSTLSYKDVDLGKGDEGYYGAEYVTWIATKQYNMNKGDTMYDLFVKALEDAGLCTEGETKGYVSDIYAPEVYGGYKLSEFTNGERSGWMYTVDGKHPDRGLLEYDLKDGDKVVWHYVNDYAYEVSDWDELGGKDFPALGDGKYWDAWLKAKNENPSGNSASDTGIAKSTVLAPKATASNGTAVASVAVSDMNKAIADAKKNNSDIITIKPAITGKVTKTSIELPKSSLSSMATDTDADLKIETPVGSVTIPNNTLESIASQASGSTVSIVVEAVETKTLTADQQEMVGDSAVFDISILSGDKQITSFDGKDITISLPYTLKTGEKAADVMVWYLNDKGELEEIKCSYDEKTGLATFETDHLSYYLVGVEGGADDFIMSFTDVKESDWFYDAVKFALKEGLFKGTSKTSFSPNESMTRAMLVTVLHRLEDLPETSAANNFTDVKDKEWYTDAILWANDNDIVNGYGDGRFGTNDPISREQMATILYRYAEHKGYDVSKTGELTAYTDVAAINTWAEPAMRWVVSQGLIKGTSENTLAPSGTATRAQVATILQRYVENIE